MVKLLFKMTPEAPQRTSASGINFFVMADARFSTPT
jgi:hypothetical protein